MLDLNLTVKSAVNSYEYIITNMQSGGIGHVDHTSIFMVLYYT